MSYRIHVAAGILVNEHGEVLLAERLGDSVFAGLWEFPGGKIDNGESAAAALYRELAEELDIDVRNSEHFMSVQHQYAQRFVALEFFLVREWLGEPKGCDGQALSWRHPDGIATSELLPADAPVLQALQRQKVVGEGVAVE